MIQTHYTSMQNNQVCSSHEITEQSIDINFFITFKKMFSDANLLDSVNHACSWLSIPNMVS